MADETSIANLALAHLGQNQIMALSDDTAAARFCDTYYEQSRDEVLASHPWTFAMKRANLSALIAVPISEWEYQYQLPTDCIRVMQMNGFDWWQSTSKWVVEGRLLLTDDTVASIRYIYRITDAAQFTPLFIEAVSVKLASRLAVPLTGDKGMMSTLLTEYERITGPKARRIDAFESNVSVIPAFVNSDFVRSRFGGSSGYYRTEGYYF